MKKTLLILLFTFFIKANAQEIKSYSWDAVPAFQAIPEEYKKEPAVILFDKRWVHTRINANLYGFAKFKMEHFAVKINESSEISKYNKVTADDNTTIRDTKDFHARVIKPNGDIRVLSESQIVNSDLKKNSSINIYPNPNTGKFKIEISEGELLNWELFIYDNSGRQVAFELSENNLELNNKEVGLYFLKLIQKMSKETHVKKIAIN